MAQQYVVFVVDDNEDWWESATEEEKDGIWQHDYRFGQLLEERGGRIVGGAGLAHSRRTRVLTRGGGDGEVVVSDGPYAETAEHLGGFFIVECDDLEVLTEAARLMAPGHLRLEIRPA